MRNTGYSCGRSMCDAGRLWGRRSSPLCPWIPHIFHDWINATTIIRSGAKRLDTKIPSTKDNYNNVLENLVLSHFITERMVAGHNASSSVLIVKERIDIIDQEGSQYRHHAKRKCLRIKSGRVPFSSDSFIWIRRCQVYCSIIRHHARDIMKWSNLKRSSWRCGIGGPFQLSLK